MIKRALKIACRCAAVAVATASIAAGCASGENTFSDVVNISDESDDNLPKATEVGANTAGCYFETYSSTEREKAPWTMNYFSAFAQSPEIKIVNDSLKLTLSGIKKPHSEPIRIEFTMPHLPIDSLTGLQALSHKTFAMNSQNLRASITHVLSLLATHNNRIAVKSASLYFTRCRRIYQDGNTLRGVSVAGRFDLTGVAADTIQVTVSGGRFDLLFKTRDANGVFQ